MNEYDFTQAVAVIRVYEKRLLSGQNFDRIIDSNSYEDALKILAGFLNHNRSDNLKYEEILKYDLKQTYDNVRGICPYKEVIDFISLKYDYHNLKVSLKGKYLNKDFSNLFSEFGKYDAKELNDHILDEDYDYFDADVTKSISDSINAYNESNDPRDLEIKLDKGLYKYLIKIAKDLKSNLALDTTKYSIDFINFKTLLRIKRRGEDVKLFKNAVIEDGFISSKMLINMYSDDLNELFKYFKQYKHGNVFSEGLKAYLQYNNFSCFEKLADDFLMNIIKPFKYYAFGMDPIISFLNAKENEIKILRIILVGKINNISSHSIRERMREVYV